MSKEAPAFRRGEGVTLLPTPVFGVFVAKWVCPVAEFHP